MEFYQANFAVFALLNSVFAYREYSQDRTALQAKDDGKRVEEAAEHNTKISLKLFQRNFLPIYLLVNGADWLQAILSFSSPDFTSGSEKTNFPSDEKNLAEEVVAALFMTGFLAGAISAYFTGKLADRHGRRLACLCFCIIYSLSCLSLLTDDIAILFLGRVLGGISTTLMYSVFESWMVTEFNKKFPNEPASTLSGMFSLMTTLNTVVAIVAGVVAGWVTDLAKTEVAPFMTAIACLIVAFCVIWNTWGENFGDASPEKPSLGLQAEQPQRKAALPFFIEDKRFFALGLTSTFFEGSMYIFIFFKFPALKLSHKLAGSVDDLPFGLIFAILMCSMMLGSFLYNYITTSHSDMSATRLLIATLSFASASFFIPVVIRDERVTFWCFCVFEICCGVYFPLIAFQKGRMVDDGVRANVYGLMRIPLNILVVVILGTTKEGVQHRDLVFTACSALLLTAVAVNGTLL